MSGRTILALFLAPFAAGAINAAWLMAKFSRATLVSDPPSGWSTLLIISQFFPGVISGALFELFILLPLLYLLQRIRHASRLLFVFCGIAIWYAVSLVILSLTSLAWDERFLNSAMFLVPGVPLVVVFALLARFDAAKA